MKSIKPILNKIVVRPDKAEEVSKGGIHIPDIGKDKPSRGLVLYVGPGRWENGIRVPMQIEIGDTVFYSRTFAQPIKMDEEDLVVIKEEDVLVAVS